MSFLRPELVTFELRDGEPVLYLAVDAPEGPDEGWAFVNRMTMCVVDGPGDAGFVLARLTGPAGDAAPQGWDEAVDRAGGTTVVFGTASRTRTIFVPSVG